MLQIVIDKQAAVPAFVWQEELWQYGRQAAGAVAALGMKNATRCARVIQGMLPSASLSEFVFDLRPISRKSTDLPEKNADSTND